MKRWLAASFLSAIVACAVDAGSDSVDSAQGELGATGTAGGEKTLPNAIHWVRNSAEHTAALLQAYRLATLQLDVAKRAGELGGDWGVVLDADETIVDNSKYNKERSFAPEGSTSASWDAWVARKEGVALPGALPFLQYVKDLGGRVFIVTGRAQRHCPSTSENLRAIRVPFDALLCKAEGDTDKNGRFQAIEQGQQPSPYGPTKVALYLGDNILDFPALDQTSRSDEALSPFGTRFIVIPNPMYGSWESLERK